MERHAPLGDAALRRDGWHPRSICFSSKDELLQPPLSMVTPEDENVTYCNKILRMRYQFRPVTLLLYDRWKKQLKIALHWSASDSDGISRNLAETLWRESGSYVGSLPHHYWAALQRKHFVFVVIAIAYHHTRLVFTCWVGFSSYSSILFAYSKCPPHAPNANSVGEDIPDTIPIHPDLPLDGSRRLCRRRLESARAGWTLTPCPF